MNRKQQRIVCVDTNVLIWGVRKEGNPEKIEHALNLFVELDAERDESGNNAPQILVPTVVLAEFVTSIKSRDERDKMIGEISQRFTIIPFDTKAVSLAAELWHVGKTNREKRKTLKPGSRPSLRADSMIVATAWAHGAKEFYSEDADVLTMARDAGMLAKPLPTIASSLFPPNAQNTEPAKKRPE